MRKYMALTKALLKSGLGMNFGGSARKGQTKSSNSSKILLVVIVICFLPLVGSLAAFGRQLYVSFSQIELTGLATQLLCYACSFMVLILAIPYVLATFFLSSDLETLLPLPLKGYQLVGAKFTAILIYEYLLVFLLLLPLFCGYGIAASATVSFWIILAVVVLFLPIVPLVYASLFGMVLMHLFRNVKNKELITTIGSIIMVVGILALNMFIQNTDALSKVTSLAQSMQPLTDKMNYFFPNVGFAAKALDFESFLPLLLFLLITFGFLAAFLFLSNHIYLNGVMGAKEGTSKRHKMTSQEREALGRQGSPVFSYLKKELHQLLRTPVYLLNCVMTPFIMIIVVPVPILFSIGKVGDFSQISLILQMIPSDFIMGILFLATFGLSILVGCTNLTVATCISREGQGFLHMKYIPMSYRSQLQGKVASGIIISLIPSMLLIIPACIFASICLDISILVLPACIYLSVIALLFTSYIQLLFDLIHPKLIWESEQAAVKQNFTAVISMFVIMILGIGIGAASILIYNLTHLSLVAAAVLIIFLTALTIFLRFFVYKYGEHKLRDLE